MIIGLVGVGTALIMGGLAFFGARALIRRTGMSGAITESPSP